MAAIVENVEKTARTVLRRALSLLERSGELATRIAEKVSSIAARGRGSRPNAARREAPLHRARIESEDREVPPSHATPSIDQPLPEGHMVARVAGEEEAFRAPIPLVEEKLPPPFEPAPGPPPLPAAYHDNAFVALARDPFTLWLYWDFAPDEVRRAMEGLQAPRTKLRVYQGEHRVRDLDFALESHSYYVNDLSPGERYQAEIVFVGRNGERRLGALSNPVHLPNFGPSAWSDDRFATLPWDARLPKGLDAFEQPLPFEWEEGMDRSWSTIRRGASEVWHERRRRPEVGSAGFIRPAEAGREGR